MEAPSPRYIITRAAFLIGILVAVLYGYSFFKKYQRKQAIIADLQSITSDSSFFQQFYVADARKALIRAIVCPVLFIRGEQGFPGLLAQWQLREAAFGHIERVTVAGGHHFHMENSSETAVYIENFAQIR